jgi:hypothetical protein
LHGPHRKPAARLFLCLDASEGLLQFVETVASTCQQFVYELETFAPKRDMYPHPRKFSGDQLDLLRSQPKTAASRALLHRDLIIALALCTDCPLQLPCRGTARRKGDCWLT